MKTVLVDNLDKRVLAGASERRGTSRFGLRAHDVMQRARHWQHGHVPAKPQSGARLTGALLLAAGGVTPKHGVMLRLAVQ